MSTKLKIWGRNTSSNVQTVMWTVAELGLDHERFDVGGAFGGTDSADFQAMNPMGLVPALQDGDLTLFESAAITRYLAAKYGDEAFWPSDLARRAELDQWAEWTKTTLYPVLIKGVFWQLIRTPSAERDATAFAQSVEELGWLMTMVERRLGNAAFLGGDQLSFADILFGHLLYRYYTLEFERVETPNLDRYYKNLVSRPEYVNHVMIDYMGMKVD